MGGVAAGWASGAPGGYAELGAQPGGVEEEQQREPAAQRRVVVSWAGGNGRWRGCGGLKSSWAGQDGARSLPCLSLALSDAPTTPHCASLADAIRAARKELEVMKDHYSAG